MSKVEANKQMKRDKLLNSSFHLFTTKGFHKTSISDIVEQSGVGKGTFYLYFKDKLDIRNKLVAHKSSILFKNAYNALDREAITDFTDRFIFVIDQIIDQLSNDHLLMNFIAKNLSWGIFKNAISNPISNDDMDFEQFFQQLIEHSPIKFRNPETMFFMIIELTGSSCYSCILNNDPLPINEFKPFLYDTIRGIIHQESIATVALTV